jgi:hypothetical protein
LCPIRLEGGEDMSPKKAALTAEDAAASAVSAAP